MKTKGDGASRNHKTTSRALIGEVEKLPRGRKKAKQGGVLFRGKQQPQQGGGDSKMRPDYTPAILEKPEKNSFKGKKGWPSVLTLAWPGAQNGTMPLRKS